MIKTDITVLGTDFAGLGARYASRSKGRDVVVFEMDGIVGLSGILERV